MTVAEIYWLYRGRLLNLSGYLTFDKTYPHIQLQAPLLTVWMDSKLEFWTAFSFGAGGGIYRCLGIYKREPKHKIYRFYYSLLDAGISGRGDRLMLQ